MDNATLGALANRFCATRLPETVTADLVAIKPGANRYGTNLLTVTEAKAMLAAVLADLPSPEEAFRAGHAAAEETLGAHGSEHLLSAIESSWARFADDHGIKRGA